MSQKPPNPNGEPPRKKRRWYYKSPNPPNNEPPVTPPITNVSHQDIVKRREKEKAENEENVKKIERRLHEYFQNTNTPYSYLDETGVYKYTPAAAPPPAAAAPPPPAATNPFMNLTYTPFTPSLFSEKAFPNVWATIIPIQLTTSSQTPALAPPIAAQQPIPKLESIDIRENIQHIDDLIALCDKYPLSETKKYNINMTAIHAIREPLTDLSNMIGMDTIKRTIVDQILYYLQDLHIPEKKNQEKKENDHREEGSTTNTLNPFATPFTFPNPFANSSSASASASVSGNFEFKPMNIKIPPPWANGGSGGDDFASPTKGDFMHTVIYGPPGSGKTEVAKIIGRIFSNLGILTKKTFKKVSRNDLVAGYLGQTAIKTKDMIKASLGGVLFIDEAYSLGNSEKRDSFAKECVDTLCEALSEHKHNWMVIIAGYEKELNNCFFNLNEGLNSRFTWRFKLDAYKPDELKSIYEKQVRDYGWTTTNTSTLPESWFAARMDYFTTYGRDMETLFTKTKIAHSRRVFCLPVSEKKIITMDDLENGYKLFIENPEVKERKERVGGGAYMKTLYL